MAEFTSHTSGNVLVAGAGHHRPEGRGRVLSGALRLGRQRAADGPGRDLFDVSAARQGSRGRVHDAAGGAAERRAAALERVRHGRERRRGGEEGAGARRARCSRRRSTSWTPAAWRCCRIRPAPCFRCGSRRSTSARRFSNEPGALCWTELDDARHRRRPKRSTRSSSAGRAKHSAAGARMEYTEFSVERQAERSA